MKSTKSLKKRKKTENTVFFLEHGNQIRSSGRLRSCVLMLTTSGKGSEGEGETGKKDKTNPDSGGKSVIST